MNNINIIPVGDTKKHSESEFCICNPRIELIDGGKLIIHNSFDGRELIEKTVRALSGEQIENIETGTSTHYD